MGWGVTNDSYWYPIPFYAKFLFQSVQDAAKDSATHHIHHRSHTLDCCRASSKRLQQVADGDGGCTKLLLIFWILYFYLIHFNSCNPEILILLIIRNNWFIDWGIHTIRVGFWNYIKQLYHLQINITKIKFILLKKGTFRLDSHHTARYLPCQSQSSIIQCIPAQAFTPALLFGTCHYIRTRHGPVTFSETYTLSCTLLAWHVPYTRHGSVWQVPYTCHGPVTFSEKDILPVTILTWIMTRALYSSRSSYVLGKDILPGTLLVWQRWHVSYTHNGSVLHEPYTRYCPVIFPEKNIMTHAPTSLEDSVICSMQLGYARGF